jgi:hypothetical protein
MTELGLPSARMVAEAAAPIDPPDAACWLLLVGYALLVLTSASPERLNNQFINLAVALVVMRWRPRCRRSA